VAGSNTGITVDHRDHVWIGGSARLGGPGTGRNDDMITGSPTGENFCQLGHRDGSRGNGHRKRARTRRHLRLRKTKEVLSATATATGG
jgi:hypothetical protein